MLKYPDGENLCLWRAGLFHDIGKKFTKTDVNAKGIKDGDCHYYGHENVSAYLAMLFMKDARCPMQEQLYVANLIFYHMRPHTAWKQSKKAEERDRKLMGEKMYQDLFKLHEADVNCR